MWLAALASNIGSLMQGVAAAWLMTSLTTSPVPVALLTTVANLPLFLVGLPAGALADMVDRRWLVIVTQIWMLAVAVILSALAAGALMTPFILLALTFLLSLGGSLSAPAWQAIVPDLVPRRELPSAIALNSAGFNLARATGPALGGLLVAASGPAIVFFLNAISFVAVIVVIYRWQPAPVERSPNAERMTSAIVAGIRFTRHSPPLRAVLVRTAAFIFAASALWALLPVIATKQLGLSASGYGLLLASIGLGAVGGAVVLPRVRDRFSIDQITIVLSLTFAACLAALAIFHNLILLNVVLMIIGAGWLSINSSLNVSAQLTAPSWVQARALGVYLLVSQGGLAGGSAVWGLVADRVGEQKALLAAAVMLALGVVTAWRWSLQADEELDLSPSQHWPEPVLARAPHAEDGPVLITVEYKVTEADQDAFGTAMQEVQLIRLRNGASRWELFHDAAEPDRLLETFEVPSWAEHLRQHERTTVADREAEERATALLQTGTAPVMSYFISTRADHATRTSFFQRRHVGIAEPETTNDQRQAAEITGEPQQPTEDELILQLLTSALPPRASSRNGQNQQTAEETEA